MLLQWLTNISNYFPRFLIHNLFDIKIIIPIDHASFFDPIPLAYPFFVSGNGFFTKTFLAGN